VAVANPGIVAQPQLIQELVAPEIIRRNGTCQAVAIQVEIRQLGELSESVVANSGKPERKNYSLFERYTEI